MKMYYRPTVLGRYLGLIKHYEHLGGTRFHAYYSLGFWWGEVEFK